MKTEIEFTTDQLDDLNMLLNADVERYTAGAAALKSFSGAFAQEQAEEYMTAAAKAAGLIALLM